MKLACSEHPIGGSSRRELPILSHEPPKCRRRLRLDGHDVVKSEGEWDQIVWSVPRKSGRDKLSQIGCVESGNGLRQRCLSCLLVAFGKTCFPIQLPQCCLGRFNEATKATNRNETSSEAATNVSVEAFLEATAAATSSLPLDACLLHAVLCKLSSIAPQPGL
jgi:hypothetical protein